MLESIIFGTFAGLLLFSSMMVVFANQTMYSILWLVLSFISASALWVLLNAEFLGLLLILVYVGAVLTLFLFVIMTLSSSPAVVVSGWRYTSHSILSLIIALLGLACLLYGLYYDGLLSASTAETTQALASFPQQGTQALGIRLYTDFVYPFELVGMLLLTAIIVSISLHSDSRILKNDAHAHSQHNQLNIRREDRIKLVKGD